MLERSHGIKVQHIQREYQDFMEVGMIKSDACVKCMHHPTWWGVVVGVDERVLARVYTFTHAHVRIHMCARTHTHAYTHMLLQIVRAKAQSAIDNANRDFQNAKSILGSKMSLMVSVKMANLMFLLGSVASFLHDCVRAYMNMAYLPAHTPHSNCSVICSCAQSCVC